jgi:hypothetical protein
MPDRDEFAKATKLGRNAAGAIRAALEGGVFDPFPIARLADAVYSAGGGLPTLPLMLALLREREEPHGTLLPGIEEFERERLLSNIDRLVQEHTKGRNDLIFARSVQREVLAGSTDPRFAIEHFFRDVILGFAVESRGGLIEDLDSRRLHELRDSIERLNAPVVRDAAERLLAKPDRRRLGLVRTYRPNKVTLDEDVV